jgi:hypothetical protein
MCAFRWYLPAATFSVAVNGKRLDAGLGPYQGTAFNR